MAATALPVDDGMKAKSKVQLEPPGRNPPFRLKQDVVGVGTTN